jgi:uncharacterized protein YlaN (UPF0358 family)
MVDLSHETIKKLFHQQIREITQNTVNRKEEIFDFQMSGAWIK